jgi:thiol-disulfide isomerase/thioredoxin
MRVFPKVLRVTFVAATAIALVLPVITAAQAGNNKPGEPTDPKARKTFADAKSWEQHHDSLMAIDSYRKANKQDGYHCLECLRRAYTLASGIGDYKAARTAVQEGLPAARTDADRAIMHYWIALALQREGIEQKKDKCFADSCDEFKTALALNPGFASPHFGYGVSLAYLRQDDAARAEFSAFLNQDKDVPPLHLRAQRFIDRVDLARARMAPAFSVTTLDGQNISLDSLAGKVVLIDFWATWCGPCRNALPHMRKIVKQFQGQPFVAISISLDSDDAKWKAFVAQNEMTWLQYRDGGFDGPLATRFGVRAIPATFSIDADGVLEDQHVGDESIEGKLKKLVAQAVEMQNRKAQMAQAPFATAH